MITQGQKDFYNYIKISGDFKRSYLYETKTNMPEGWSLAYDVSTPSCRLLNQPYDPDSAHTQYYIIDGFIVSPNVTIDTVKTVNLDFANSDHNPVELQVTLK